MFMNEILQIINTLQPLSFVRYGDGEAIIINGKEKQFVYKRQLGRELTDEEHFIIYNNLINTYANADILGFPQAHHLERKDIWSKSIDLLVNRVPNLYSKKNLQSVDFFHNLLEKDLFSEILLNKKRVAYISCRNIGDALKQKYNIKKIDAFHIAPEMKFTSYKGEQHFPNQYNHIREWIKKINPKETICLVGGGVVGKVYCNWFKKQGGTALDIGSVFDSWDGKLTRGQDRGLDVIDNTFKL